MGTGRRRSHPGQVLDGKAQKREKILEAARKWMPVPALGVPPAEVSEPFTVMLWGITTDTVANG